MEAFAMVVMAALMVLVRVFAPGGRMENPVPGEVSGWGTGRDEGW